MEMPEMIYELEYGADNYENARKELAFLVLL